MSSLRQMAAAIRHRGPDDEGFHSEPGFAFGMRRLSIIDLAGGHQPLSNAAETVWAVCNGEIYNFRDVRARLEQAGHRFQTRSDSEVLVHLYAKYGDGLVDHLEGMYGFAVWDVERRRLLIGRDRLGVKPIYYALNGGRLFFASELKSLLAAPGFSVRIDPVALRAFLSLGYVPAPLTLVEGVRKLPPASLLKVERGEVSISTYWSVPEDLEDGLDETEWATAIREELERAVHSQMVSDVPIGAFLSGGIDSSAVVAFMSRHSKEPVRTYSIGFEGEGAEGFYNELPYARQVAELFGTEHKEILVKPDVIGLLPRLLWHMDEPVSDSALITTYLVSEFARRDVKVILSGVGGDELFGGYRRYLGEYYDGWYRKLPHWLRKGVVQPLAPLLPADRHSRVLNASRLVRSFLASADLSFEERYRRYVEVFSRTALADLMVEAQSEPFDALGTAFEGHASADPLQRLLAVDVQTQLPDDLLLLTDKMTMATSLECRVPLLDHRLVELGARIPARHRIRRGELKYILKRALSGVLPEEILNRSKRGFGAPMGAWLKQQLSPVMKRLLSRETIESRGLFRWEAVGETIAAHETNRADHTDHLLALINLEIWCRLFVDGESHEDVAAELKHGDHRGDSVRLPSLSLSS